MSTELLDFPLPEMQYPVDFNRIKDFSFNDFLEKLRQDTVLADKFFFPTLDPLFPFQAAIFRALDQYEFVWIQAGRGLGKSYVVGRWAASKGLTNSAKFVYTGPTYRQSKLPWEYTLSTLLSNYKTEHYLDSDREIVSITSGTEQSKIVQHNGTRHTALPMGDGSGLRGQRAHVLILDEFFNYEKEMYAKHVLPFLQGYKKPGELSKVIIMTSAEHQDTFAYSVLTDTFIKNVRLEDELVAKDPTYKRKYCIIDVRLEDAEREGYTVNWSVVNASLEGANQEEREQVLKNKWISSAGAFMPPNILDRAKTEEITVEYEAEPGYDYGLAVDVATQLKGDYFVTHVIKFLGDQAFGLVNSYWDRGLSEDAMAWIIHKFNQRFNPSWVVMDPGGGGFGVQNALAKPVLSFFDGSTQEVDDPILITSENRTLKGSRKLVLVAPNDEMLSQGFAAERSRGGEFIRGNAHLKHIIFDGFKKLLYHPKSKFVVPAHSLGRSYENELEENVLERIHESVRELKLLSMQTKENEMGVREVVKTAEGVPKYRWGYGVRDGAQALCYAYACSRLYYAFNSPTPYPSDMRAVPTPMPLYPELQGRVDYTEGQVYKFNR